MVQQTSTVHNNAAQNRFEIEENGLVAFATYRRENNTLMIPHVEAPPELRGKGTAGRLMEGIALLAREGGLKIVPRCPYAATWFRRHPEDSDVLA